MIFTVGLESYRVMAVHGYYEHELDQPQPYIISIWVDVAERNSDDSVNIAGDLSATVDYALLQKIVDDEIVSGTPARLMEDMCRRMLEHLTVFTQVSGVRIRIEKPEAPLPHDGGLPVVEMNWKR